MSRGPGQIERAIESAFRSAPSQTFSVDELAVLAYPDYRGLKAQRVAVIRAANNVAARNGWKGEKSYRPGHPKIYYNSVDLRSYAIFRLRSEPSRHSLRELEAQVDNPSARDRKLMEPGGTWWRQVELHRAEHEGRAEDAKAMREVIDAELAAWEASARRMFVMTG